MQSSARRFAKFTFSMTTMQEDAATIRHDIPLHFQKKSLCVPGFQEVNIVRFAKEAVRQFQPFRSYRDKLIDQ